MQHHCSFKYVHTYTIALDTSWWMLIRNTWLAVTWGSLCGNIQRHRWAALPLVDGSDGHRVSSTGTQVVESVWGDSAEQIRVLCSVGLHTVNGELQVQETYSKDTFSHKWKLIVKKGLGTRLCQVKFWEWVILVIQKQSNMSFHTH